MESFLKRDEEAQTSSSQGIEGITNKITDTLHISLKTKPNLLILADHYGEGLLEKVNNQLGTTFSISVVFKPEPGVRINDVTCDAEKHVKNLNSQDYVVILGSTNNPNICDLDWLTQIILWCKNTNLILCEIPCATEELNKQIEKIIINEKNLGKHVDFLWLNWNDVELYRNSDHPNENCFTGKGRKRFAQELSHFIMDVYVKELDGQRGGMFEKLLTTYYALYLSFQENVRDFKMRAFNQNSRPFDDLEIEITFSDCDHSNPVLFLIQLKHRDEEDATLNKPEKKLNFDQYIKLKNGVPKGKNVVFVLITNAKVEELDFPKFEVKTLKEEIDNEYKYLRNLFVSKKKEEIFCVKEKNNQNGNVDYFIISLQECAEDVEQFAINLLIELFHDDENESDATFSVDMYQKFFYFINRWRDFKNRVENVLTKYLIISKLTELACRLCNTQTNLMPMKYYLEENKCQTNNKFDLNVLEKILDKSCTRICEDQIKNLYKLEDKYFKREIAWHLGLAPIIVTVKEDTLLHLKSVLELLKRRFICSRILIYGYKMQILEELIGNNHISNIFPYVLDLIQKESNHHNVIIFFMKLIEKNCYIQQFTIEKEEVHRIVHSVKEFRNAINNNN